jgi:hypothetical protein
MSTDGHAHVRLRLDSAALLKRFHFLERSLTLACAAWIPRVHRIETKALLARTAWQSALTGDALRARVFELRYPSRLLEIGEEAARVTTFDAVLDAPSPAAFLAGVGEVLVPALRGELTAYLELADEVADGPSRRFLTLAVHELDEQENRLGDARAAEPGDHDPAATEAFVRALASAAGSDVAGAPTKLAGPRLPFVRPAVPARDDRYFTAPFYWPDTLDPSYRYGDGITLQLRSAVSHLNEVWAVETAGSALHGLAPVLGWEFVVDAARWTYDEARHMLMGKERLERWGVPAEDVPLGSFIYEAWAGTSDDIFALGMLGYFETKNIRKKRERAATFHDMGDRLSERDMQFDWADETIHAEYGRRWLKALLEQQGRAEEEWSSILEQCEQLVEARVAQATDEDRERVLRCAERLVADAEARTTAARL